MRDADNVNQNDGQQKNRSQYTTDNDRVDRLMHDMYGDGEYWPGVIRRQNEIVKQQGEILNQLRTMMFWIYFLTAVLSILVVLGIMNLVVLRMPI